MLCKRRTNSYWPTVDLILRGYEFVESAAFQSKDQKVLFTNTRHNLGRFKQNCWQTVSINFTFRYIVIPQNYELYIIFIKTTVSFHESFSRCGESLISSDDILHLKDSQLITLKKVFEGKYCLSFSENPNLNAFVFGLIKVLFWIKKKNSKADRNAYTMPFLWNEFLREQWENRSHLTYTINWIFFYL